MRFRAAAVAVCVLASLRASGQPLPIDPTGQQRPQMPQSGEGGGTRIPISATDTEVLGAETAAASVAPVVAPPVIAVDEPIDPAKYICGPGDILELNFWGQQNFRLRVTVDLEGRSFISKVGYVEIGGKSLATVRTEVKKRVRATYPGLQFDLTLAAPRAFVVHVAEMVKQPGAYTAGPLDRVATVLARAGGITGSKRRIAIKHKSGAATTADLTMYELTGDASYNPYLLDGDTIDVPVAQTTVNISGAVPRPGTYELIRTKDLTELFALAGGLTGSVARTLPLRIVRHDEKQRETFDELSLANGAPNAPLHDLDAVLVPDIADVQRSVLLMGAVTGADTVDAVTSSRRVTFVDGDTVESMLERAGGIKSAGDLRRAYISRPRKQGSPELIPVDLEALMVRRDRSADVKVQIGDLIVVPAMQYGILVEGAVSRPGAYPFNPQFGMQEYIARAGGLSRIARPLDEVKLIDTSGHTRSFKGSLRPQPGDSILVPERNFTRAEVVQLVIAGAGLILSGIAVTLAATR